MMRQALALAPLRQIRDASSPRAAQIERREMRATLTTPDFARTKQKRS
jgi:hypothetical protein